MTQYDDTVEIEPVNRLSSLPILFRGMNQYMLLLAISVLSVLLAATLGIPARYALTWVGFPVLLLTGLYLKAAERIAKERRTTTWQRAARRDPTGDWVSQKAFHRTCFVLNELPKIQQIEDVVNLVTRKSPWRFLRIGIPCGVLAVWLFYNAVVHPTVGMTTSKTVGRQVTRPDGVLVTRYHTVPVHHTIPTGTYYTIGVIVLLVVILLAWMDWYYTYHMITNINVRQLRVPPLWLPFLRRENKSVKLRNIETHDAVDTALGNMLGYGSVKADTPVQHDEALRNMNMLPHHQEVDKILEAAIETARLPRV
jgi:hypothetical protein